MELQLHIAPGSNQPLYRQLQDQIRAMLSSGKLRSGETLPSVRALAEQLVINPNTVARAYAELVREGLIESSQGKGFFVGERRQIYSDIERQRRLKAAISNFAGEVAFLDFDRDTILKAMESALGNLKTKNNPPGRD